VYIKEECPKSTMKWFRIKEYLVPTGNGKKLSMTENKIREKPTQRDNTTATAAQCIYLMKCF